jgi:hypothetical protein
MIRYSEQRDMIAEFYPQLVVLATFGLSTATWRTTRDDPNLAYEDK